MEATDSSPPPRCPVCCSPVGAAPHLCPDCNAPYHEECWAWVAGCAIYGCRPAPGMAGSEAAAAGDLDLEIPLFHRARQAGETLPPRIIVWGILAIGALLLVLSPMATVLVALAVALCMAQQWRIYPVNQILEVQVTCMGLTVNRRRFRLQDVRRFEVQDDDGELAITASFDDGRRTSLSLGSKAGGAFRRRFEAVVHGIRTHTRIPVLRYRTEDAESGPKRVEALRHLEHVARGPVTRAVMVNLAASGILLWVCWQMQWKPAGWISLATTVMCMLTVVMLITRGAGTARLYLSPYRLGRIERLLWNEGLDPREDWPAMDESLLLVIGTLMVALFKTTSSTTPTVFLAVGGLVLARYWCATARALTQIDRGVPWEPAMGEPMMDSAGRIARVLIPLVASAAGGIAGFQYGFRVGRSGGAPDYLRIVGEAPVRLGRAVTPFWEALLPLVNSEATTTVLLSGFHDSLQQCQRQLVEEHRKLNAPESDAGRKLHEAYGRYLDEAGTRIGALRPLVALALGPIPDQKERARQILGSFLEAAEIRSAERDLQARQLEFARQEGLPLDASRQHATEFSMYVLGVVMTYKLARLDVESHIQKILREGEGSWEYWDLHLGRMKEKLQALIAQVKLKLAPVEVLGVKELYLALSRFLDEEAREFDRPMRPVSEWLAWRQAQGLPPDVRQVLVERLNAMNRRIEVIDQERIALLRRAGLLSTLTTTGYPRFDFNAGRVYQPLDARLVR